MAFIAFIIALALALYTAITANAARARGKSGIKAPAVTGDPMLERALGLQRNTLEQLIVFIPALWVSGATVNYTITSLLGLVWLAGRVIYARAYLRDPDQRSFGFVLAFAPQMTLLAMALLGSLWAIFAGVGD